MKEPHDILDGIRTIVAAGGPTAAPIAAYLQGVHPSEIARMMLEFDAEERRAIFDALSNEQAAEVLVETDTVSRRDYLEEVADGKLSDLVSEMPPDEGADIVELLSDEKEQSVLGEVAAEQAESIRELIRYEPDTAGGRMTTEYIAVSPDCTVARVIEEIRGAREFDTLSQVFVLGPGDTLVGVASLRTLVTAAPGVCIGEIMAPDVVSVSVDTDQEDVARTVEQYNLDSLPIVDHSGALKGIITVDDVLDVVEAEATEDLFRIAGTSSAHPAQEKVSRRIRLRLPWLMVTLCSGIIAFLTLQSAKETLTELISIASFVPLVVGIAGSVGIQSSTVVARGLATGEVRFSMFSRILSKEILVALGLGLFCGLVAALASLALAGEGGPRLGLIVGLSMVPAVCVAAVMGTVVPLTCHRLGIDPALASGPFITSANDIVGLTIYLTIAKLLMGFLPQAF